MTRTVFVGLLLVVLCLGAMAEEAGETSATPGGAFDLAAVIGASFSDIARMPTRLTMFNQHDDAAKATYICCRPDQEEDIARALKANAAFLTTYGASDYADDTLMHNARINGVRRHFRGEIEAYNALISHFPQSDLADDACWGLAQMHARDKARPQSIAALAELVKAYPDSTWADDSLGLLAKQYKELDNAPAALGALETLVAKYPASDHSPPAWFGIAKEYQSKGSYAAAIDALLELQRRYPFSDFTDDAQFAIGNCFRAAQEDQAALEAYEFIIHNMPGSSFTKPAMREANTLCKRFAGPTGRRGARTDAYDMNMACPCQAATDLYDRAAHFQRYRMYKDAAAGYMQFARQYPGHDRFDDAIYNLGICYQELNMLFAEVNKARGPDDLFRLKVEWEDALGSKARMPENAKLSAVSDAASAFEHVAYRLIGSPLRDDALYELARTYEDSGRPVEEALTYQQLVINFPGSPHEMEALTRTMRYYADPKNYPACLKAYALLAKSYPTIFPKKLGEAKDDFLTVMGLYRKHTDFAWDEYHVHHIPYRFTLGDLQQDANFYLAALEMRRGNFTAACNLLKPLTKMLTSDFCAPARFLMARAYEERGKTGSAQALYEKLIAEQAHSGLADDARVRLARLKSPVDVSSYAEAAVSEFGDAGHMDCWVGKETVVFAPWIVTAKMRQYNLPNVWEQARVSLGEWTGNKPTEKLVIVLDEMGRRGGPGNPLRLSARQVTDPPRWGMGFYEMAASAVSSGRGAQFVAQQPAIAEGLARFAAGSMQMALVSETRDAVGSAVAVMLPNQEIIDARKRALDALQEYVRETPEAEKLTSEIVCGMLFTLLDRHGQSKQGLANWEPYSRVFSVWNDEGVPLGTEDECCKAFVRGLSEAFGTDLTPQFQEWGLGVGSTTMTSLPG